MFSKVLIVNRGEIALRILNSLHEHGIEAVLTVSPIDKKTLPAKKADDLIVLPGNLPNESYLNQDFIIDQAKSKGIDAIHPGYGFLAENKEFRKKVEKAGITYVGPSFQQMEILGDKVQAREAAIKSNTPLLPGTLTGMSIEELKEEARNIGFPILIKAAAGGGGRGIRLVMKEEDFIKQAEMAKQEAKVAFGDDRIYVEKYLTSGKHIEVQVLGTGDGHILHFFERDCSMQRKKQKIIEEGPAPSISRELASSIHQAAVGLTSYIKYENAGTVEFLLDSEGNYYFLEVNTRIQVEHPVTEMITQEDLIWRQFQVAAGVDLELEQKDISYRGHAIEARIYAENGFNDFSPSTGKVITADPPIGPGIRVDSHLKSGDVVSPFYDSMLAKVIAYGRDRTVARKRLDRALKDYKIVGVHTTAPYIRQVLNLPEFDNLKYDTKYLEEHADKFQVPKVLQMIAGAAVANKIFRSKNNNVRAGKTVDDRWKRSLFPEVR